jgi:hypothetical protein
MKDKPDFGYDSYNGTGKLKDLVSPWSVLMSLAPKAAFVFVMC